MVFDASEEDAKECSQKKLTNDVKVAAAAGAAYRVSGEGRKGRRKARPGLRLP